MGCVFGKCDKRMKITEKTTTPTDHANDKLSNCSSDNSSCRSCTVENIEIFEEPTPNYTSSNKPIPSDNSSDNSSCTVENIVLFEQDTMKKIAEFDKGEINYVPKTENYNTTDDLDPQDISYWENFGHFKENV